MVSRTHLLDVLLVEDNPGDALLVRESFEDARVRVALTHAASLGEALDVVGRRAPSCVLLDLNLPDATGFDGLHGLLASAADVPVIVLTGQQQEGVGELAVHLGAQDYLMKGKVDGALLERSIRHAIERHEARRQLEASEARFRALVHNLTDIVCVFDDGGVLRFATPSVERVLALTPTVGSAGAQSLLDLVHPDDQRRVTKAYRDCHTDGGQVTVSCRALAPDGAYRDLELVGVNLLEDPAVRGIVITGRDVTEREEAARAKAHQALHDPLTGLANRQLFMNRLEHALQRSARTGQHVAVLFVDLDRFQAVNDAFGHGAGDEVLRAVAGLLEGVVRPDDTVARLGADEFIVLCEGLDAHGANRTAARIAEAFSRPFGTGERSLRLSASIGIAVAGPGARSTATDLVRDADVALARAKSDGRSRVVLFDGALRLRSRRRAQIAEELGDVVERAQLELHFQPQVDLRTGSVVAFEALLRWHHPELGEVSPAEFIPIAEHTGAIRDLGRWVLVEACRQLGAWRRSHPHEPVTLAVNVSAAQLSDPGFPAFVLRTLHDAGADAGRLRLEITESAVMGDPENSARVLAELRSAGIRLSIDDFGTGYSSLTYLKRFPIDELKIDRSFVSGLGRDGDDTVIVSSVVHLAKSLGITVVAEGVETPEQLEHLVTLGCDLGQGFHWAAAEPAAEATRRLGTRFPRTDVVDVREAPVAEAQPPEPAGESFELDAIAAVVHELRTPITVVRGFSEMMADLVRNGRTDLLEGALDAVHRQTRQMELLVADLADASAVANGGPRLTLERIDLRAEVAVVVEDLGSHLDQHRVELPTTSVEVEADGSRVRQILTNLLTNAAKFAPPATTIAVDAEDEEGWATVRVTDAGPGVPAAREGELFGKFQRLGATSKGMGIGLYLSRELARAHGGDLSYRRAPAGGAEFTLRLPSLRAATSPSPPPSAGGGAAQVRAEPRTRALVSAAADPEAVALVDRAMRRLLQVQLPEQVVGIAIRLVRDLGGVLVPATTAGPDVLPVDVSFGVGEPLVVAAPAPSIARMRLEGVLPTFLEDARDVVQACRLQPPPRRTKHDAITGLLSRRALLAPLTASPAARDLLVIGFGERPPAVDADAAIRTLARAAVATTDERELAGRWDDRRLVVTGASAEALHGVAAAVRATWHRHRPESESLSGVVLHAGGAGTSSALTQATATLRRVARNGGGVVEVRPPA